MSRKLSREEAEKLGAALRPGLGYLSRLVERMNRVGFATDDEVLRLAPEAAEDLQALTAELHGVSVRGNVWRES